jgi:hypothetical protein
MMTTAERHTIIAIIDQYLELMAEHGEVGTQQTMEAERIRAKLAGTPDPHPTRNLRPYAYNEWKQT